MTKQEFAARLEAGPLIVDGATGSNLIAAGMPRGVCTELWVLEHPEVLIKLQQDYVDAGSQVLYAPTFQANSISLQGQHVDRDAAELVRALVPLSQRAAAGRALVAGDVSTTGKLPAPHGSVAYEQLLDCYTEEISALAEAGVDLIVAETLLTTDEAMAILDAAAGVCALPVLCSLTIEADGSLLFGGNIFDAAADLESMGAAGVGVNCSVGPDQLESVIAGIADRVSVPVIAKPNAGMPEIQDDGRAVYSMDAVSFARHMRRLRDAGASVLGGCCGTTPDYIRAMCAAL